jgi:hypothetical protein
MIISPEDDYKLVETSIKMLFGVTVILYFLKILSGSCNYWPNLRATNPSLHAAAVTLQKLYYNLNATCRYFTVVFI